MKPTGIQAILVQQGVEAAILALHGMLETVMKHLNIEEPPDEPETPVPSDTTKEGA